MQRSRNMSKIKSRDTSPEKQVRSLLHKLGFRFRLQQKTLPGKPDIVLKKYKSVIFVNGCFWHGHEGCKRAKRPQTHTEFWNKKIDSNIRRDEENIRELTSLGWHVLTIWECELKNLDLISEKLINFLREKPNE